MTVPDLAQVVLRDRQDEVAGEGACEEKEAVREVCGGRIHRGLPAGDEWVSHLLRQSASCRFRERWVTPGVYTHHGDSTIVRKYLNTVGENTSVGTSYGTLRILGPRTMARELGVAFRERICCESKYPLWVASRDGWSLKSVLLCARTMLPSQYQKSASLIYAGCVFGGALFGGVCCWLVNVCT